MIKEFEKSNKQIGKVKTDLGGHIETYMATFKRNEFYMDKTNGEIKIIDKKLA